MTTLCENQFVATYQINSEDYEKIQCLHRYSNNISSLEEPKIDHCTFELSKNVYILIAHGSSTGFVQFNGKLLSLPELEIAVRKEQNLLIDEDIIVKLMCCHDRSVGTYLSKHCWIINNFNTDKCVQYKIHSYDNQQYISFNVTPD